MDRSLLRAKGVCGELLKSYHIAAWLDSWSLEADGRVEAHPGRVDQYWIDAPGVWVLRLKVGRWWWRWKNVTVMSAGQIFDMRVNGPPEIRD